MSNYLIYILKVSSIFTILYLIYYLIFRRLTFHWINRIFLLLIIPLSLFIPVLSLDFSFSVAGNIEIPEFEEYMVSQQQNAHVTSDSSGEINWGNLLIIFCLTGTVVYIFRLVLSALKLIRLKKTSPANYDNGFLVLFASVDTAFSFLKWIFIPRQNREQFSPTIFEHEKLHATLWHSLDLIITETFIAFFWFNPFVYFFRKSIKSIHEYQVDAIMVKNGIQKSDYLKLILDNLESKHKMIGLYNYFNALTIKNRIKMITENKSSKTQIVKYFSLLPLLAFFVMAFSNYTGDPPELFPLKKGHSSTITSQHGEKIYNPFTKKMVTHKGIDIKAPEGTPIVATSAGVVKEATQHKGYGNLIVIDHGNGFESWYAHTKDFKVKIGQSIKKGQTIAHVGNTGYSTNPHLHFEIRLNKERVDPLRYVKQ